jgi:hypothetical protein
MFENERHIKRPDPAQNTGEYPGFEEEEDDAPEHELDSAENEELHRKLLSYYRQEIDRQYENRAQMAIDADFYDHIQWTDEDAAILRERGQAPMVYNVISQSVNWIIGSEKRGRIDFKVLPRGKEDAKPAEQKTALLKYLSDVNRTPFHRSRAFEDAVKVGVGWVEDGVQDDDDGEPVYSRYESWRNVMWDSASTELDLSDSRYVTRTKWVDLDVAIALFPDREQMLEESASAESAYGTDGIGRDADEAMDQAEMSLDMRLDGMTDPGYHRRRVRLIEVWFRRPTRAPKIVAGDFAGDVFDPSNPDMAASVEAGSSVVAEKLHMRMHCAIMTTKGMCYLGESPYRHNRFPFTPIWGYRRDRDGLPYGVIRGLRDIQEDINKRASKAQYIMATNKTIMDKGAVDDLQEYAEEVARPDGIIIKNPGKALEINADRGLEQSHLDMMGRNIAMIQQVSGVTDELMGRTTNAQSGRAIENRQQQGMMSTAKLFDNMRLALQIQGENQLSLVEQYFTEHKVFRITNQRGSADFVEVNDGLPEHDIHRTKADFVISEDEWRATMRQAQADQLMEMVTRMPPEVAIVMLDLIVEAMDVPNRDEIVKRIRQISGQRDPDATELTPEEIAAMEQQQYQQQMQQQMLEAQLREQLAKAGKTEAEAQRIAAQLAGTNVDTQKTAMESAQVAMLSPQVLRVADKLLREAGYLSRTEIEARQQAQAEDQMRAEQQAAAEQEMQQRAGAVMEGLQAQAQEFGAPAPEQPM